MTAAEKSHRVGRRTILFVDEIHRFNKAQQDAFLPHVERGNVVLIGATTENPSFEVISALLSRARVFVLNSLTDADIRALLERAARTMRLMGRAQGNCAGPTSGDGHVTPDSQDPQRCHAGARDVRGRRLARHLRPSPLLRQLGLQRRRTNCRNPPRAAPANGQPLWILVEIKIQSMISHRHLNSYVSTRFYFSTFWFFAA